MFNKKTYDPPLTKAYFRLVAGHHFDMEDQRNILLQFIEMKGLTDEFMEIFEETWPECEGCGLLFCDNWDCQN